MMRWNLEAEEYDTNKKFLMNQPVYILLWNENENILAKVCKNRYEKCVSNFKKHRNNITKVIFSDI